ncbi:hypothetical protein J7E43_08460 [Bacillus sp. ISL-8]|nr:hypothetical protein [Bacillus sp. ISL-8]
MTKEELIAALEEFDDNTVIKMQDYYESCIGEPFDIEGVEDYTDHEEAYVLLV